MLPISTVFQAIDDADRGGLLSTPPVGVLSGFSGAKFVGLLQRLAGRGGAYLEIGVFQGMTLLSTAYANPEVVCYGVDNFSQFDPGGRNEGIVRERGKSLGLTNWRILNMDMETALDRLGELVPEPLGTYLIDGPHDYRSQLICLGFAADHMAPGGAIIVDDANYRHVRQATADFLKMRPDYKLVFEAYTPKHPVNMTPAEELDARAGWWDGIHVLVRDVEYQIEGLTPPTDTALFFNDHQIHSMRWAPLAFEAAYFMQSLLRPRYLPGAAWRLLRAIRSSRVTGRQSYQNTYSENLATRTATQKAAATPQ